MKKREFVSLSVMGLMAFSAFSGQIKWSGPYEISGDAGVRQNGELVYAYSGSGENVTVNGVAFKGAKGAQSWDDAVAMEFAGVDSTSFGRQIQTSTKCSAALKQMLTGAPWCDNKPVKMTLKRLIAGKSYLVQVWVNDSRELACERTAKLDDGKAVLFFNKGDEATFGTYALGVFVADGAEQSFTLQGNQSSQLNAIQVRAIESAAVKLDLAGEVIATRPAGGAVKAKTKDKGDSKVEVKDDPSRPLHSYLAFEETEIFYQFALGRLFARHIFSFASRLAKSFTTPSMIAFGLAGQPGIYAATGRTASIPDSTL